MNTDTETIGEWSRRIEETSLIVSGPVDSLIKELERRLEERRAEHPGEEPTVALTFVLDRLLEARNRAANTDTWLPYKRISQIGDGCHPETVRRKAKQLPDGLIRENGWNGKHEVHIEGVAKMLDMSVEEVREAA